MRNCAKYGNKLSIISSRGSADSVDEDIATLADAATIGVSGVRLSEAPLTSIAIGADTVNSVPLGIGRAGQALTINIIKSCTARASVVHEDLVRPAGHCWSVHLAIARALRAVKGSIASTLLAHSVDQVESSRADAGCAVEVGVGTAGRS